MPDVLVQALTAKTTRTRVNKDTRQEFIVTATKTCILKHCDRPALVRKIRFTAHQTRDKWQAYAPLCNDCYNRFLAATRRGTGTICNIGWKPNGTTAVTELESRKLASVVEMEFKGVDA